MAVQEFKLGALVDIDGGRINEALNQAIKRAAMDCEDRPADDRARKVNLQIELTPMMDDHGMCDSVKMAMQIKETIPTRKSRVYDLGLRRGGMLVYQPDALDNHAQDTFEFGEDGESPA